CRLHFVRAADFADHDDGIGIRIFVEHLEDVHVLEPVDGIATNAHGRRLPQPEFGDLGNGFISERARTADYTNAALAVNMTGHDADLDFVGRDQARADGSKQQRLLVFSTHAISQGQHVTHLYAFRDADDEVQVGIHRFPDGVSRPGRRYVNDGNRCPGCIAGVFHGTINGDALEIFAG